MTRRPSASLELALAIYEDGRRLKVRRWNCHSYVIAYFWLQQGLFQQANPVTQQKDTGGTLRTMNFNGAGMFKINAAAADNTLGIQVGTGTAATSPTNFQLATLIAQGSGSGQLQYASQGIGNVSASSTQILIALTRAFTNSSGGTITVNEVGLVQADGSGTNKFLTIRDLVSPGQAINNGQTLTATYTMKATT